MERFRARVRSPLHYAPVFDIDAGSGDPTSCARTDDWVWRFQALVDAHIPDTAERLKVAVLDTGLDVKHPEFADEDRLKERRSWVGSAADVDSSGHGTHIVSTILSLTENVDVYVAKISEGNTFETTEQIAEECDTPIAIQVASEEWDVDIISLSFGLRHKPQKVQDEIKKAVDRGKLIFAAASNSGANDPRAYPASQEGVICVHSADGLGNASLFNPTELPGPDDDNFCFVGENIEGAWPSSMPDQAGGTRRMTGTSYATAVAIAVAALMIGFVRENMPEHVNWDIPPLSLAGIRAIFHTMSEQRNGQRYDLVNPVRVFGGDTPAEQQEVLEAIRTKLERANVGHVVDVESLVMVYDEGDLVEGVFEGGILGSEDVGDEYLTVRAGDGDIQA
ncbi:peptidase S8/S53 domain-containing protein [Chaetomium fimeti]|uniref:Peptidase S8/S53 domain-containing protein n=1 Tax=Chaetomium fimeti TaxID=1854472 RepID=A0AAE0HNH2_9PEZI|nr:peptidase S8/S53 domain-containing protein [Chaetomium fimeti]